VIRLYAGYSSRLGPRSSNEDRCVAFTDWYREVNEFMSANPIRHSFYGDDRGANWKSLVDPPRSSSYTDAYFAVYDGHSGSLASQFLQNVLHHSIYT
jgi:serine/threonine protein phosphatase PrpC